MQHSHANVTKLNRELHHSLRTRVYLTLLRERGHEHNLLSHITLQLVSRDDMKMLPEHSNDERTEIYHRRLDYLDAWILGQIAELGLTSKYLTATKVLIDEADRLRGQLEFLKHSMVPNLDRAFIEIVEMTDLTEYAAVVQNNLEFLKNFSFATTEHIDAQETIHA